MKVTRRYAHFSVALRLLFKPVILSFSVLQNFIFCLDTLPCREGTAKWQIKLVTAFYIFFAHTAYAHRTAVMGQNLESKDDIYLACLLYGLCCVVYFYMICVYSELAWSSCTVQLRYANFYLTHPFRT